MGQLFVLLAVVALIVAAAAPAGAAKAEKTSYIVAECADAGNPQNLIWAPNPADWELDGGRIWFSTELDRVHIRGLENLYDEYLWTGSGWLLFGSNATVANGNAAVNEAFEFIGPFWGTFDFTDDGTIGDFSGTWSWGMSATGRAVGTSDDGSLVKITLGVDAADYLPLPLEEGCGVTEFMVISK
jgi:hypothetical protein